MKIQDLSGKSVCILGFGREGQAMLKMLEKHQPKANITIADTNQNLSTTHPSKRHGRAGYPLLTGKDYLEQVTKLDPSTIIIKSPGIPSHPLIEKWKKEGRLTTGTQIFFDSIKDTGAMVIGITGSKGKSTTSTLIYEILHCHSERSRRIDNGSHGSTPLTMTPFLIGNIGKPAIEYIDEAKPGTIFVMEMSSYQLMDLAVSPHIAVITSFFPEHLDYHGSIEAYKEAKSHITEFQGKDNMLIYAENLRNSDAASLLRGDGKKIVFSASDSPVTLDQIKLKGTHNLSNISAAFKVASHLGVPRETAIDIIKNFAGLPHRLQSLGIHHGIEWIDDAISTTPESAIAALDALGNGVTTIILGGQDRGNDFSPLAKRLKDSSLRHVILLGESSPRIEDAIKKEKLVIKIHHAQNMEDVVKIAIAFNPYPEHRTPNPVIVLSPASPSYDMFKNFEEKGNVFKKSIMAA